MEKTYGNFFPRTTFSLDQHGHISLCYALQLIPDGLHCRGFPENNVERRQIKRRNGLIIVHQGRFPIEIRQSGN
jgi:hypothetical protein